MRIDLRSIGQDNLGRTYVSVLIDTDIKVPPVSLCTSKDELTIFVLEGLIESLSIKKRLIEAQNSINEVRGAI